MRCVQEASQHEANCFITLTYATEKLPVDGVSWRRDFQLFLKRLRKHTSSLGIKRISYFGCGEFGEKFSRPHFHSLIFGFDFPDRKYWKTGKSGCRWYTSALLSKLWANGHSSVGSLTYESAAYTAQYVMKKITGKKARDHYPKRVDPETGEITWLGPEFVMCSLKPAIGASYFEKYAEDCYPSDFVVVGGKRMRVPRYYDRKMQAIAPAYMEMLKAARAARVELDEQHPDRLRAKAKVLESRLKLYGREIDESPSV